MLGKTRVGASRAERCVTTAPDLDSSGTNFACKVPICWTRRRVGFIGECHKSPLVCARVSDKVYAVVRYSPGSALHLEPQVRETELIGLAATHYAGKDTRTVIRFII